MAAVVNVIVLPMSFLSGAFGSTEDHPAFLQVVGDVLPLKHLLDLTLAAYVDGEPPWQDPVAVGVVLAWGAAGYLIALARFGWEPRER